MTNTQHKKLISANIAALEARLKSGKPLTAAQIEFIQANAQSEPVSQTAEVGADVIAKNASDLANRIGVSRQVIAYHKGREDAPKTFSTAAWRQYLSVMGKLPTAAKMEGQDAAPVAYRMDADTAFAILFNRLSDALPGAVKFALAQAGVKVTARRADLTAWLLWIQLAAHYQRLAGEHDAQGPFAAVDNGQGEFVEYPTAIKELAGRISKTFPNQSTGDAPAE